jgi:2'-5' RNA ligase
MKRIFIALKIDVDETFFKLISVLKSELSNENIKWTNPENIHVTLAFLGDTEEKRIKIIKGMLDEKCRLFGNFQLIIRGTGVYRSLKDPRVLWTGIEPSEKLMKLNSIINNGLKNSGTDLEERPFKPHLTIGRIKYLNETAILKILIDKYQNTEIQRVMVKDVILYESILLPAGPVYKPLSKHELEKV